VKEPTQGHDGEGNLSDLFNLDAALERVSGNMETVKELALLLREEGPKMLQEIREGLAGQDARRVQRGAHTIKGSAIIFAAERVVAAAARVETMGREGNLNDAEQAFPELQQEVERLCAAVALLADDDGR
jgi:HPt (histidine-containing phosphotransfer) domain-containing protein